MSDRNVVKAAETRNQLDQLQLECVRLKKHLEKSVPESEFIKEKNQYMEIIAQLIDENVVMRKMLGELKNGQLGQFSSYQILQTRKI